MRVLVPIDQAEALRQGIDAPASTATVNFDPADLDQVQRDILTRFLVGGFNAAESRVEGVKLPALTEPTLAQLKTALDDAAREITLAEEQKLRLQEEDRRRYIQNIKELISTIRGKTREYRVFFDEYGQFVGLAGIGAEYAGATMVERKQCYVYIDANLPVALGERDLSSYPELAAEYAQAREESVLRRREAIYALKPKARQLARRKAERTAREKSEWDRLYAKLPESTRRRIEAGYSDSVEVEALIRQQAAREALSLVDRPGMLDFDLRISDQLTTGADAGAKLTSLKDAQFEHLEKVRKHASAIKQKHHDCEVLPVEIRFYRQAHWSDPTDLIDEEGEVHVSDRGVLVAWRQAGLDIALFSPFPGTPETRVGVDSDEK